VTILPRPAADQSAPAALTKPAPESIDPPAITGSSQPEPQESPFLSDAKVEKRPLGGLLPLPDKPDVAADVPPETEAPSEPEADNPPPEPSVNQPELSSDLVAIESGGLSKPDDEPAPVKGVESAPLNHRLDEHSSGPEGPTAIARQYKEQPSSGDQSHAAIYDASQYGTPLSHPPKKAAGWLWILWVVLLLAAGGGGAYLLYSLGILS
jgi:hypothetical protein